MIVSVTKINRPN